MSQLRNRIYLTYISDIEHKYIEYTIYIYGISVNTALSGSTVHIVAVG